MTITEAATGGGMAVIAIATMIVMTAGTATVTIGMIVMTGEIATMIAVAAMIAIDTKPSLT
jgi:hypothetical protein